MDSSTRDSSGQNYPIYHKYIVLGPGKKQVPVVVPSMCFPGAELATNEEKPSTIATVMSLTNSHL